MPSWGIHLAVGKALSENMKQQEQQGFLLGNLLPDVNVGYLIEAISKKIPYEITHHAIVQEFQDKKKTLPDYEDFIKLYKDEIEDPILLGYLTHLVTDYFWNYQTYIKKGIYENHKLVGIETNKNLFIGENETIRKMKVNDFNHFSSYLYQNRLKDIPFFETNLISPIEKIKEIHIEECDIQGVNQYFKEIPQKLKEIKGDYQIYTQKEIEEYLDENISFVQKIFEKIRYK